MPSEYGLTVWFGMSSTLMCWCTHLPPKLKLACYSILAYLAGTDPQRELTEAQGHVLSPPVTMPGQPDGQLDVTAAKPGGQLLICCSEAGVQLYFPSGSWLADRKMAYHRKNKSPDNKFQTHMDAEGIIPTDPAVVRPPSLVCGLQKTWVNLWLIPSDI